jgi:hypothetical protein
MNNLSRPMTKLACYCAFLLVTANAYAISVYDESIHGDLSGNRLAPTQLTMSAGVNSLAATTGRTFIDDEVVFDQEYVRVDLPADHQLTAIRLMSYSSFDGTAFIGVQDATTFSFDPDDALDNIGTLLGYAHFGPDAGNNSGDDILPSIGLGAGAIGFAPPLFGSSYTFWLQQTGSNTTYQLDFVVAGVPEPAAAVSMLMASVLLVLARKRRVAAGY